MEKIPAVITQNLADEISSRLPFPDEYLAEAARLVNVEFNRPGMLLEKLASAYAFIDKVNSEHISKFTSCNKGCSHCCRIDVQLTNFEAEYIAVMTGVPHVIDSELSKGHRGSPCPFLKNNGECSIYLYRPLFCRTYHVMTEPALCAKVDADVLAYGTMGGKMGNLAYLGLTQWIHYQDLCMVGRIVLKDIRDFFPHGRDRILRHLRAL